MTVPSPLPHAERLHKSLTLFSGTLFFLNIVIGAGLLVLPGLIYHQLGQSSVAAWLICSASVFPLLLVFILLGKDFPSAGGITTYASRAFGPIGLRIAAYLFLGAVLIGMPGTALTGGFYLSLILPTHPHLYAFGLVLIMSLTHLFSGKTITKTLEFIGALLLFILIGLMVLGYISLFLYPPPSPQDISPISHEPVTLLGLLHPYMTIFFAFTGWEVGSTSAEEFKNPARDFPKAMVFSYIIAIFLYSSIAILVSLSHLRQNFNTPFYEILYPILGSYGHIVLSCTATLLIIANLFGGIWAISRLVYSLGKDKIIPSVFGRLSHTIPTHALVFTWAATSTVLVLDGFFNIGLGKIFALAGQNLLLLYALASAALFKLTTQLWQKFLACGVVGMVAILIILSGKSLYFPAILTMAAVGTSLWHFYANSKL
ncbi:APC family permease [Entomobacter blattae]|uniref:Amino acid permease n=1 Tax=Entomobacter blattae TaxID=2762277 RepID=A0A7H1NPE5_9PROT|nr:APC family permease [Entomobacter blattae]QNT77655.1 Amino acid permease [Entomobacter blattae]